MSRVYEVAKILQACIERRGFKVEVAARPRQLSRSGRQRSQPVSLGPAAAEAVRRLRAGKRDRRGLGMTLFTQWVDILLEYPCAPFGVTCVTSGGDC